MFTLAASYTKIVNSSQTRNRPTDSTFQFVKIKCKMPKILFCLNRFWLSLLLPPLLPWLERCNKLFSLSSPELCSGCQFQYTIFFHHQFCPKIKTGEISCDGEGMRGRAENYVIIILWKTRLKERTWDKKEDIMYYTGSTNKSVPPNKKKYNTIFHCSLKNVITSKIKMSNFCDSIFQSFYAQKLKTGLRCF